MIWDEPLTPKDRLIVALDVAEVSEARALVKVLEDSVGVFKIGLELLYSGGFPLITELTKSGHRVFVDAKLLDIEATVEKATAAISRTGASFLTVHASDRKTMDAAVRGRDGQRLKLLGVTVLTNLSRADLAEQGVDEAPLAVVQKRAMMAQDAGFDGVVASGLEAGALHERLARDSNFAIVTPGIRPAGAAADDQTRVVTPRKAIQAGATYLVVGRPITQADDPKAAADALVAEIGGALSD